MGTIDEVSQKLGRLEATMDSHGRVHEAILTKLDRIDDKLTIQNGSISKAHNRMDRVEEISQDYETNKKRLLLALLAISTAGGAAANGAFNILKVLFGG